MMKEAIGTGATIDAAIAAAKFELNAPEDADVVTEILETPSKKTLGFFGGTPAKARAYYEESEFSKAEKYIKSVLRLMGVDANVLTVEEDDGVRFSIDCGGNDGYVIGRRGETLDALQYLVRLVVSRKRDDYRRVMVNVGDYREQREQTLRELALSSAGKAKKFGRNISLPPMSPYDRRIVHTTVQEFDGANSFSVGEGGERRVVVAPDEPYRRQENKRSYNRSVPPQGQGQKLQRNQRNAEQNRRFPGGGANDGYRPRSNDDQPRYGGDRPQYNNDRPRYNNDRPQYNNDRPRYNDRPRGAQNEQPRESRPPRSDVTNAGRYGRIEPRKAQAETPEGDA
jgi:spoIIIJ-associated protein